jgi:hypothetical protein
MQKMKKKEPMDNDNHQFLKGQKLKTALLQNG